MPLSNTQKKWAIGGLAAALIIGMVVFWPKGYDDPSLPDRVDFNAHIRPLLSQNCFTCHGPDSSSREAGLRLDTREGAIADLEDGGAAIVPGNIGRSLLLQRISSHDPDERMPPPSAKKILNEREIALLTKWIDQGAEWKPHWAFISPEMPDLPRSKRKSLPSEVIDHLIDQKIKEQGLETAPRASQNALVRRLSYILTGLPPTEEEIQQFTQDASLATYEKAVDHYLASPHFGERWARHWMDLVRYGEGMGHEFDFPIHNAYEYRDYLIRAFNQDVPYDQFVKEHLAGDMLEEPRYHPEEGYNESVLGTGYYFLGEGKHSPVNLKLEELDKIDNGIDVTSKTFQALTVACAKCHDHKFDPIPTTDYYAMYGMFESMRLGPVPARQTREQKQDLKELVQLKQSMREQLAAQWSEALSNESVFQLTQYLKTLDPPEAEAKAADEYQILADFRDGNWEGWDADGMAFGSSPMIGEPVFDSLSGEFLGLESGFVSSRAIGKGVQGILRSSNFTIDHDTIAIRARGKNGMVRLIVDNFQIIQGPLYPDYEHVMDSSGWKTYYMDAKLARGHKAFLQFTSGHYSQKQRHRFQIEEGDYIDVQYAVNYRNGMPSMARPPAKPPIDPSLEDKKQAIQDWAKGQLQPEQLPLLHEIAGKFVKKELPEGFQSLLNRQETLLSQLYDSTSFIGMSDGEAVYSPVFIRGSIDNLSPEKVPHRFLDVLQGDDDNYPQEGSGRLAWAEAVVDAENPLSARVITNRLWHHVFGRGIVETVDNFGLQGKAPSHPELLDYLAMQIQQDGWSMKQTLRHILLTESFQRSTLAVEANQSKDPDNIFLHHFPVRRIEAEAIRDGILAVSGRLNREMFGPPVPVYLSDFMTGRGRARTSGPLDGEGRRSIYIAMNRNFIPPMMLVFDMPTPFSTFGKRNTTNVPAQSLTLMNDPFVQEQAGVWANKVLAETDSSLEARVQAMYMRAFARPAESGEIETAREFLSNQAKGYDSTFEALEHDPKLWADYCHALMNLKEFIHLL